MEDLVGLTIDHYEIKEYLGGGMSAVYLGYDTTLRRKVAIKVTRSENAQSPKFLSLFSEEARSLALLDHPNIVKIFAAGQYEGQPYLVMEYVPGSNLEDQIGAPIPVERAAQLLLPVANALEYAHQKDIIHMDVKPGNILLTEAGVPRLSDFGIARRLHRGETTNTDRSRWIMGTRGYMAPEQAAGLPYDHRVDIYAMGVVFYEMLTGRLPFETPEGENAGVAQESIAIPDEKFSAFPRPVREIFRKTLAIDPNDRYLSMDELAGAFEKLLKSGGDGFPIVLPSLKFLLPILMGAVLLAVILVLLPTLTRTPLSTLTGKSEPATVVINSPAAQGGSGSAKASAPTLAPSLTPEPSATPAPTLTPQPTLTPVPTRPQPVAIVPIAQFTPAVPWLPPARQGSPALYFTGFRVDHAPFDNLAVRMAFARALDREIFATSADPARFPYALPATGVLPREMLGLATYQAVGLDFDLDEARALAQQAAAAFPGGNLPEVEMIYFDNPPEARLAALSIQMFEQAGLLVKPVGVQPFREFIRRLRSGDFDLYQIGMTVDASQNDPAIFFDDVFFSQDNFTGYTSLELQSLKVQAGQQTGDILARQQTYLKMDTLLCEQDVPVIPMFHYSARE